MDPPAGRSLALVADQQWRDSPWRWRHEGEVIAAPDSGQVIVLKPGEIHSIRIAFEDPTWSLVKEEKGKEPKPTTLGDLGQDGSARFRPECRPPDRAACTDLPYADLIWHGRLLSRSFTPFGRVDWGKAYSVERRAYSVQGVGIGGQGDSGGFGGGCINL